LRKNAEIVVSMQSAVRRYMGAGSTILLTMKLNDVVKRAAKLHTPIAVAAKRVGNRYEFAAKLMLKAHVTPNFVNKKKIKKRVDS